MKKPVPLLAAALLLSLAALSFASRPGEAARPGGAASARAGEAAPLAERGAARVLEGHEHTQGPPLTLSLEASARDEATGVIVVRATIQAERALGPGVQLAAIAPGGGAIVGGEPSEALDIGSAGATVREFRVRTARPPTEAEPVRIVVDWRAPNGAMGLHAERRVPEASEPVVPPRTGRAIPPPTRLYGR